MSKWAEWKKNQGKSKPWHLLDFSKHIQDKSIIEKRMQICSSCENFLATKQCKLCGCFMPAKTMLSNAGCPIGKWHREDQEHD